MARPEKHRIRSAFDRAALSYDAAAVLQREVCHRLLALLPEATDVAPRLLDAGCGTGYGARLLSERWPQAGIVAADFSPAMAGIASKVFEASACIVADMESLPLRSSSQDGYWSSLAVQWCDPQRVMNEVSRVLDAGGWLALSTLGEATYAELREAFSTVDRHSHTLDFSSAGQLMSAATQAGLREVALHRHTIVLHYPDLRHLLGAVKAIGANSLGPGRRAGMMGKSAWQRLTAAYELHRTGSGLPASYDVILLTAKK